MVSLTRSKATIELGKRLVKQLDVQDDLLASWMAHDIAERIKFAESSSDVTARDDCAKAILQLWEHRNNLQGHLNPLHEFEIVLKTLTSLNVDQTPYHYQPEILEKAATARTEESIKKWLDLAIGLDYSARLLIQFALRSAVENLSDKFEPWAELAIEAGASEVREVELIRFILADDLAEDHDENARNELKEKIQRLEAIAELSAALANELQANLDSGKKNEG